MSITDSKLTTVAQVEVQSSWASKINWTQAVSGAAMLLTFASGGKIGMTIDQQAAAVTVIGVATNVITWIFKTWFTTTITPASAADPTVPTKEILK